MTRTHAMIIRLSLLCHASTAALRAAAFPTDEALDPAGEASLAALVAAGPLPADRGWSAPELRTMQTTTGLGLSLAVDARLREWDHGRWRGSTLAAVQAREPDAVRLWLADPAAAPHGGESLQALLTRVGDWLRLLPSSAPPSTRIIAVTHPAVIRACVVVALGAPAAAFWRLDVPPLSSVVLSGHGGRWNLRLPPATIAMTPEPRLS